MSYNTISYQTKLASIHPNLKVLHFVDLYTEANFKCTCGLKFVKRPLNAIREDAPSGCPACTKEQQNINARIPQKEIERRVGLKGLSKDYKEANGFNKPSNRY